MRSLTSDERRILNAALRKSGKIIANGYTPNEIDTIKKEGAAAERARIVALLRVIAIGGRIVPFADLHRIISFIERGEHAGPDAREDTRT